MSQYEMAISEHPVLGQWNVYVNMTSGGTKKESQVKLENFQVEKYVLPTFEVEITPPPYVLANAENVTWKICGRYTYGKLVKGNVSLEASFEGYGSWDQNVYPKVRHEAKIDGCMDYTVYDKDIGWLNYSYHYRPLKLYAKITEEGTDVEQNSTKTITLANNPVQLSFSYPDYNQRFFKLGMPFVGEVSVTNPDGSNKAGEVIQICAMATTEELSEFQHSTDTQLFCKNLTSNEKGIVRFTVPPRAGNYVNLKLQADAVNHPTQNFNDNNVVMIYHPTNTLQLRPWYSVGKRSLQIIPLTTEIACGEKQDFTVYFNGEDGEEVTLHSQVMSREGIVSDQTTSYKYSEVKRPILKDETYIVNTLDSGNAPEAILGVVTVPVEAKYEMAPKGYLLVYYVRPDGEIIADSVEFPINKCLKNKVGMEFLSDQELPGSKVGLKVTSSPNSYCGIGAIDKSIYLLSSGNLLTPEKVFEIISSSNSNRFGYSYYPQTCVPTKTPGPASFTRRKRSIVLPPYRISSSYADSLTAFQNGNFLALTDLTLVTKPCSSSGYSPSPIRPYYSAYAGGGMANKVGAAGAPEVADMAVPGPPGAGGGFGGSKPVVEVRENFPETWLWEMFSTDADGEFITKRELPHTITQWVASAVCLNEKDGLGISPSTNVTAFQPFFVSKTLPYSVIRGEISPVIISVFNYLKECMPITLRLEESDKFNLESGNFEQHFCVCGGNSVTHKYLVKPTALGHVNFTTYAYSNQSNNVCGNNIVSNVTARDAAKYSLLVEAEGFQRQESFSNFFCPANSSGKFTVNYVLQTPDNYVPDSARAEVLVTGDLMGPALRNLDNLVQMPTGCGEQNMLSFVPDIFILDYLTNTGGLTPDLEKKLLEYLRSGYQRELTYRHVDGSYSAFGDRDTVGSIWLTAFVVKSFEAARRFVFVDTSDISRSMDWIEAQQDGQGCFPEVGEVHHTAMKGGSGSNLGSKATLTSYILISLLEANRPVNSTSIQQGLSCLAQEKNPTTYTLALITYASCLAKADDCKQKLEQLMALKKTKGGADYWEDDSTNSAAIQVETASYALLALLTNGGEDSLERALPIVRWIAQRRNANGGFISTQDTVMGLQALAKYSTGIDKNPINIDMTVDAEGLEKKAFHVDEKNKLLVQVEPLSSVPTPVDVEATGTGCALVQANLFYNVKTPPNFQAFSVNVSSLRGAGGSCKKSELTFCMNYNYEDRFSNMAVLEVRPPSGYDVDQSSVDLLKRDHQLFMKLSEINNNVLALYFSKVGPTKKCFSIRFDQTIEVQNLQPSTYKLFDYYQPENSVSGSFKIDEQCP